MAPIRPALITSKVWEPGSGRLMMKNSSVTIYDHDGIAEMTYTTCAFPMMHCFRAGPALKPTLWMAKNSIAYGFSTGFDLSQGDHAHMEAPVPYAAITTGTNPVQMGSLLHRATR
jgi:hypothetical protein